jgi:hypothetical protein
LTLDEFADRAGEVYAAQTQAGLESVLADLPDLPDDLGPHAFISYSRTDEGYAQRLSEHLHRKGVPTWTDRGIRHGDRWTAAIEKAMQAASVVVVVMTPASRASDWVERELILAEQPGNPLAPLLLEGPSWWTISNIQYETVAGGQMPSEIFVERLRRYGTSTLEST